MFHISPWLHRVMLIVMGTQVGGGVMYVHEPSSPVSLILTYSSVLYCVRTFFKRGKTEVPRIKVGGGIQEVRGGFYVNMWLAKFSRESEITYGGGGGVNSPTHPLPPPPPPPTNAHCTYVLYSILSAFCATVTSSEVHTCSDTNNLEPNTSAVTTSNI